MANLLSLLKKAAEKGYREKVLLGQIIVITVSSTEPCSSQVLEGLKKSCHSAAVPFLSSHRPLPGPGKSLPSPGLMATLVRWHAAVRVFGLFRRVNASVTWQPPSPTPS